MPTGSTIPNTNYQKTVADTTTYDEYIGRLDYNIGKKDLIYGAYETTNPVVSAPTFAATNLFDSVVPRTDTNAYVQETHTFGGKLLNTARFGYNSSNIETSIRGIGQQNYVQQFGLKNLNPASSQYAPPAIGLVSHSSIGNPYTPQGAKQKLFEYADEVDWTVGKHTIFFGGELDKLDFDGNWVVYNNGDYSFNGQYTSNHNTANLAGGADIADFLLGFPYNPSGATGVTVGYFRQWNVQPFVQDDWKISRRLTLNLGLRYDFYGSPNDSKGHSNVYDITTNTNHPGTFNQNYLDFAPRVGFAYAVDTKTTVHGGYGIYYAPWMYTELQFLMLNAPNYLLQSYQYDLNTLVPITDAFVANPGSSALTPFSTALRMPTPNIQQWNLSVQRSLGSEWIATVSYLGEKFSHSNLRLDPNQASVPTDPSNPSPIQSRRPYSWIADVLQVTNAGYGNYNGLEAELEHHYSHGFSLLTSYVYSKALDIVSGDNPDPENSHDLGASYGPADYNMTNVFKISPVYQLPFGPGHTYLSNNNWLSRELAGGWQVSTVVSAMSGTPFTVGANDLSLTGPDHAMYANQICDPNKMAHRSFKQWFNTACLVQPGVGELGNERRDNVKGPSTTTVDASALKEFSIIGEKSLQFRADFFGALNHPLGYVRAYPCCGGDQNVQYATYGQITNVQGARQIQFSLKFSY